VYPIRGAGAILDERARRDTLAPMRWIAGLVLLLAAVTASAQERTALLIGSSSVGGAVGITLDRELASLGIDLERHTHNSSGFARPDFFDFEREVEVLAPFDDREAVFLYAGGNDAQRLRLRVEEMDGEERWIEWRDEARWVAVYVARVRAVVNAICAEGARRVIVIPPIDGGREGWRDRIQRVIRAQIAGAEQSTCGVAIDANDGSAFASVDGVHLSYRGAGRMWAIIGPRIRELLGLSPR
jgi:lysophospholipase L1-like esterase